MSTTSLLLLLSPFLVLALVLGTVMVVAILRARREDVPEVMSAFVVVFCRLADRLPRRASTVGDTGDGATHGQEK